MDDQRNGYFCLARKMSINRRTRLAEVNAQTSYRVDNSNRNALFSATEIYNPSMQ